MQKITLIAALDTQRVIGVNNQMAWHLPEDFAFFKQHTLGKPIIMGRKTWDSLPRKPLPQRRNLVISRQNHWQAEGAEYFANIADALAACGDAPEIMIIGGAQIYAQTIDLATDLLLTEVQLSVSGDAYFPEYTRDTWQEIHRQPHISRHGTAFDWVHYVRVAA